MRIEMLATDFEAYRQPYISVLGHLYEPNLYEAVSAFFKDCGHRGTVDPVSVYRGWIQIEVTGDLPAIFSTNGQAHSTVFYRKVG
jgi:hypothetical protein